MTKGDPPEKQHAPARRSGPPILAEGDARRVIVLASVLELTARKRKRAITATLAALLPNETVVFVTDDLDFSLFVKLQLLYEYLPPIAHQVSNPFSGGWDRYLVARLRILVGKWSPARIVSPGTPFEIFVQKSKGHQ